MSFSYVTIASILHDRIARNSIVSSFAGALANIGGTRIEDGAVAALPAGTPLCYFILTGGTEQEALALRSVRERSVPGEPVWLIAHPLQNSLPASLEILARVKRDGGDGRIFFIADAKDTATLADLEGTVSAAAAMRGLAGARLGRVGDSSDWLVASSHSAEAVRGSWGVEVVPVPIETLHRYIAAEGVPEDGVEFKFFKDAEAIREPTPVDLGKSVGVYRALKRLVEEEKLDALTLRCFDLVLDEKTTGCFALSRLNDEGVIAGCEGDIPAALALLWVKRLTGITGWMANPAWLDAPAGRLLLAHCTVPRSIVTTYTVRSHFESSLGVGISGEFARGPVTLVRLGGEKLERLWVTEGAITATSSADGLCRTQIECKVPSGAIESMLRDPLGNHVVVVQGLHEQRLRAAFRLVERI
jgi:L-fucose isomerase-like protein